MLLRDYFHHLVAAGTIITSSSFRENWNRCNISHETAKKRIQNLEIGDLLMRFTTFTSHYLSYN